MNVNRPLESTASRSQEPEAVFEQTWDLAYRHALGETVGEFFSALKDKKLLGRRCTSCDRVLFPARSFCDRCHAATTSWVEVKPHGVLEMFTIVTEPFRGITVDVPYVLAYSRLEGADTASVGFLKGLDLSDIAAAAGRLNVGTPVSVCFSSQPEGRVTDFWYEVRSA